LQDILRRNNGADQALLHKLALFLCGNIGSAVSPNNIGNVLSNEGEIRNIKKRANCGVAGKTVGKYIQMLKSAFIFYSVGRYDVKGKQLLKTLEKKYIVDLGFRNMLLGFRDADRGHILENIVYLELLRRDYRVHIGKVGDTEVDFVAEKPSEKLYIQVTETMMGESVRERELRPLKSIRDNYEKVVLSMDRSYITSYDGIKALNIIDFLLSE
jgi:predicted AAA+ superfamily ATPase